MRQDGPLVPTPDGCRKIGPHARSYEKSFRSVTVAVSIPTEGLGPKVTAQRQASEL